MIERGYRLPFGMYPPRCFLNNNFSSLRNKDLVSKAIYELLSNQCIVEHDKAPYCVNPLTVAEGEKLRLVIELRHVNGYLVKQIFKYEDLRSLSQVIEEGNWFFTWDLKSGYHHVDIDEEHQQYLWFSWVFIDGTRRYFTFTVLPFGLSSACFCFTKFLRPLVKRWRSMGHVSFLYLDDGLGSQPDKLSAQVANTIQRRDLESSGLLCNMDKSHWVPMQAGEWLGFVIDTIAMKFSIPDKKVQKLKGFLDAALSDGYCSHRFLARIGGTVMSCALAVGPISRLLTREMYYTIESRSSWDSIVRLTPSLKEELRFWYTNIDCFIGYRITSLLRLACFCLRTPSKQVMADIQLLLMVHRSVFLSDIMEGYSILDMPKDIGLQQSLPGLLDLLLGAKAESTVRKYHTGWMRWRAWALFDVKPLPAKPLHVALFLTELTRSAEENGVGISSVEGVAYSITWMHKLAGLQTLLTEHPLVKTALEASKSRLARPVKPKEPISLNIVRDIASFYQAYDSLAVLRFLFIVFVGYAGFLRADELLKIKVSDITIKDDHMLIQVPKRKNDQFSEGHSILISRSNKITCPVAVTERLLSALPQKDNLSPLVRRIIKSKERFLFNH
ncbi:uncharacterized protein LOC116620164 [Nematostella vectensis]|uniref:uncharacterized protein LOC116620164 n=1 Tax=Nematostella vectensis TaxID=45351 RepID=UPI00138FDDDC|nr:uncharacterized protein LOC116620164 [Nematostella vectensis]